MIHIVCQNVGTPMTINHGSQSKINYYVYCKTLFIREDFIFA